MIAKIHKFVKCRALCYNNRVLVNRVIATQPFLKKELGGGKSEHR